ncbi:MAG: ketoacyl-ACP synthase III [Coriobacteriales bacterium]|jgi:3-oxoacyl-[acyl-carrier-protein] synthase-3|nr:ketoacyl-ACP synthase III [Coriobacteriales bacterium]
MTDFGIRILGTGSAAPANIMTNDDFAHIVDTSDEWIISRTGIRSRRIATEETTLSLALDAAHMALDNAGIDPQRISLVICASITAEQMTPALSCYLQRDLGLREDLLAFDLNAACSGFIYSLITAQRLLDPDGVALVVGSETLSSVTDFTDRSTCVLFGDGAGAVVVERAPLPFFWATTVCGDDESLAVRKYIEMDGPAVFRFATDALCKRVQEVVDQVGCSVEEVDRFICHQANERILANAAKQLNVPLERFFMNLADFGNTSAASIPLALDEAIRSKQLERGHSVVLAGFGGGLTSGAIYLEY